MDFWKGSFITKGWEALEYTVLFVLS